MKRVLFLLLIPTIVLAQFNQGDNVRVVSGITCVNVRPIAGASVPLGCEPPGTTGVIQVGPIQWGAQPYYKVQYSDGLLGYSAGIYLEKIASSLPPPTGSLSVTSLPGPVVLSFTARGDTAAIFQGVPLVPYSGTITVPIDVPSTFTLTLYGPGGTVSYTANTNNGVPLPALDSVRIATAAYNKGLSDGALSVGVSNVTIGLSNGKQVIR